jgi:DnaJ-class molecular chaperone
MLSNNVLDTILDDLVLFWKTLTDFAILKMEIQKKPKRKKTGFHKLVIVSPRPICPECHGSCHCRKCNGSGVVVKVINDQYVLDLVPSIALCEDCYGWPQNDNIGSGICSSCQGTGYL